MPTYARLHDDKKDLVSKLVSDGRSDSDIAFIAGIPKGTLGICLKRWGLTNLRSRNKTRYKASESGYDDLKDRVKELVMAGAPYLRISEETGIPDGSIAYLLDKWGLKGLIQKNRAGHLSDEGRERLRRKLRESHTRGRKHPLKGMVTLRKRFVTPEERLEAVRECVAKDLTYREMMDELQLSQATIWKVMKDDDILPGIRKGERSHLWRGGHDKYRGPDWYTNRVKALKRDKYMCVDCGKTHAQEKAEAKRGLSVHHIDPYKESEDSSLENLVTLCQSCHLKREHANGTYANQYFGSENKPVIGN